MFIAQTYRGLQPAEVMASRQKNGRNVLKLREDKVFLQIVKEVVLEPMFVLLVASCTIYFLLQQHREGFIMLTSVFIVAGISLFQEYRSRNAIQALRKLSSAKATGLRAGVKTPIAVEELVVDDIVLLEEGEVIAADGIILISNDFSVNESLLTGESLSVYKSPDGNNEVYKGTLVTAGAATARICAVGTKTRFGKKGLSLYVETLGSATVICVDKTGTLTENRMEIAVVYDVATHTSFKFAFICTVRTYP